MRDHADIFDRHVEKILSRDLLEVLQRRAAAGRPRCTTAWLAAAANLRTDVALERLGALERQGVVTSTLTEDRAEMAWAMNENPGKGDFNDR